MPWGIAPPRYRLPEASRLGAVSLQVSDLERSLVYYQDTIGLRLAARSPSTASLAPVGESTAVLHLQSAPGTRPALRSGRLGLYHFALVVPDRAWLGSFVQHLSEVGAHVSSADHAVSEALYLWDPDGLGIEVYADRPRASWRTNGLELVMTTERLDLRSLMAAGAGRRWSGLPEGTALGHLHLHVGDLDRADAFYHRAIGFDKTVWSYPGALFLSAGGYHHHLGTNTWAGGAPAPRPNEARLLEWEVVLPSREDEDAVVGSCLAEGFQIAERGRGAVVVDPWGTSLRLVAAERAGEGPWR